MIPSRRSTVGAVLLALLPVFLLAPAAAQAQFGKNKIQYRDFDWRIYHSPHFDVYYYAEEEHLLEKVVSFAESAYDRLSREFDYQIKDPTPLIFYATHSAFEQNNIILNFIPEGVGAFATPARNRMVLPVDLPDPELLELIAHELTHIFQYHILLQGRLGKALTSQPPTWLMEGMASYMAKDESARDKMFLRDAVVNDNIPPITQANFGGFFAYRFGHSVFDFMEERWGKDGIRDFIYEFRNTIGSRVDKAIDRAFRVEPEDFDIEFRRWLRKKYLPTLVQTGEPSDFGRRFRHGEQGPEGYVTSPAASPSGDLVAAFSTYRGEVDVVLFDARKRELIRSLTKGFTSDYQYLVAQELSLGRKMGRDLAFSPDGNTIAVFAKRERGRSLLLLDALHGGVRRIVDMSDVEQQVGPSWSPDGRKVAFAGNQQGRFDIFEIDVESGAVRNLTEDEAYDGSPVYTPDGQGLVYSSVAGLYAKLFRLELAAPQQRRQLTTGPSNDKDAVFSIDGSRIYYSSDREGIDNIFSLDPASGQIQQLTDVVTGCFMPTVVLHPEGGERVVYTGYWDGRFDLYMIDTLSPAPEMVAPAETPPPAEEPGASPEAQPTFEPDITVTIDEANKEEYGGWKLFLEDAGATVGVNSDQTLVSDSYLLFSDYLGDKRLFVRFSSIESFSNFDVSYFNLGRRLQWGARIFDDRTFFIGEDFFTGRLIRGRAVYRETGALGLLAYPFSFYHRFEAGLGYISREIEFQSFIFDDDLNPIPIILPRQDDYPVVQASVVGDTTVFADFGPLSGRRWNISASYAPDLDKESALSGLDGPREPGSTLTSSLSLDARQYIRVSQRSNLAMRLFAAASYGNAPQPFFFGGLDTLRGFDFRDFVGDRAFFANLEYRFPLFDAIRGPFLNFRGVRGRVFLDVGGAWLDYAGEEFDFWDEEESRLKDGASAYGWGFTLDMFGLDLNWDFAKRWDFKESTDEGFETAFWIGTQF